MWPKFHLKSSFEFNSLGPNLLFEIQILALDLNVLGLKPMIWILNPPAKFQFSYLEKGLKLS
jgi:hypothetical protein